MMRAVKLSHVGQMIVIALAWCLWPAAAQAQAYACPGPGPGERMVGMTQGGNGVAPVPLCVRDDSGGPAPPPAPPAEAHAALVWHPDAADVWVDGNYTGANNPAEGIALDACTKAMGDGCTAAGTWWNSSMAIIRDRNGYFYKGWAGEDGAERKQVLADCSAKQLLPCEIFVTIKSSTNRRLPGASVRKLFAASAWVTGGAADGYNSKLYVASGYRHAGRGDRGGGQGVQRRHIAAVRIQRADRQRVYPSVSDERQRRQRDRRKLAQARERSGAGELQEAEKHRVRAAGAVRQPQIGAVRPRLRAGEGTVGPALFRLIRLS